MTSLSIDQNVSTRQPISQTQNNSKDFEKTLQDTTESAKNTESLAIKAATTASNRELQANTLIQHKEEEIKEFNDAKKGIEIILPTKMGNSDSINKVVIASYYHSEAVDNLAGQAKDVPSAISNWANSNEADKETTKTKLIKETDELVNAAQTSVKTAKTTISEAKKLASETYVGPFNIITDFQKEIIKDAKLTLEKANDILSHAEETQSKVNNMLHENK